MMVGVGVSAAGSGIWLRGGGALVGFASLLDVSGFGNDYVEICDIVDPPPGIHSTEAPTTLGTFFFVGEGSIQLFDAASC